MQRAFSGDVLDAHVAERAQIETAEQRLAAAEQYGSHRKMDFVDEPGAQEFADRCDAAAESHVAAARGRLRLFERRMDTAGDEAEFRAASHRERRACMVREHEHGCVIRRFFAPPALPTFVGPRAAHRSEHVAPENPRADVLETSSGDRVVEPRFAVFVAVHAPPRARVEEPVHELGTADAERMFETLVGPGAEAVERYGKALDAEFGHGAHDEFLR